MMRCASYGGVTVDMGIIIASVPSHLAASILGVEDVSSGDLILSSQLQLLGSNSCSAGVLDVQSSPSPSLSPAEPSEISGSPLAVSLVEKPESPRCYLWPSRLSY